MRIIPFLLFVFIYISCTNPSANPNLQNDTEVRNALSKKWVSAYIETLGNRGKVPEAQIEVVTFNRNGTFSAGAKDGMITHNGKWNYDPQKQLLYMGEGMEKGPAKILKLTDKELILSEYLLMNNEIKDSMVVTYNKL